MQTVTVRADVYEDKFFKGFAVYTVGVSIQSGNSALAAHLISAPEITKTDVVVVCALEVFAEEGDWQPDKSALDAAQQHPVTVSSQVDQSLWHRSYMCSPVTASTNSVASGTES